MTDPIQILTQLGENYLPFDKAIYQKIKVEILQTMEREKTYPEFWIQFLASEVPDPKVLVFSSVFEKPLSDGGQVRGALIMMKDEGKYAFFHYRKMNDELVNLSWHEFPNIQDAVVALLSEEYRFSDYYSTSDLDHHAILSSKTPFPPGSREELIDQLYKYYIQIV